MTPLARSMSKCAARYASTSFTSTKVQIMTPCVFFPPSDASCAQHVGRRGAVCAARYGDRYADAAGAQAPRRSTLREGDLTERPLNRRSLRESERRSTLREGERTLSSSSLKGERQQRKGTRALCCISIRLLARRRRGGVRRPSDRSVRGHARCADAPGSEAPRRHATYSGSSWCLSAIGMSRH